MQGHDKSGAFTMLQFTRASRSDRCCSASGHEKSAARNKSDWNNNGFFLEERLDLLISAFERGGARPPSLSSSLWGGRTDPKERNAAAGISS